MDKKAKKLSWRMRFIQTVAFWIKNKFYLRDDLEQKMRLYAHRLKKIPPKRRIPSWVRFQFKIYEKNYLGNDCYFLESRKTTPQSYLIYFHGGAYYLPIFRREWAFVASLAKLTNSIVCVPMYPLAPKYTASCVPPFLRAFYEDLCRNNKNNFVVNVVGTSAGGGIALAFSQLIRNERLPKINKVVLLSPSVDMTPMSEQDEEWARQIDQHDCILSNRIIDIVEKWWCRGIDYHYYFASPIYGGLRDLGEIYIFTSTYDLLNIVAQRLQKQAFSEKVNINYIERDYLPHAWMIFLRTKEAKQELINIARIINSSLKDRNNY